MCFLHGLSLRCKQDELVDSQSIVAVAEVRRQFVSPEEVERPPLEAVNRGLLKTQQAEES
jgi:hypothetical protein